MLSVTYIKHALLNIFKKSSSEGNIDNIPKTFRRNIVFNSSKCIDCKRCMEVCASKSISESVENTPGGKRVTYKFDMKTCVFCGLCSDFCPKNAIEFNNTSRLITKDKNTLLLEDTLLIEDYKMNRTEVLEATQPITVTKIEELLNTIHDTVDIEYERFKKNEEKEVRGELIKMLFKENEKEKEDEIEDKKSADVSDNVDIKANEIDVVDKDSKDKDHIEHSKDEEHIIIEENMKVIKTKEEVKKDKDDDIVDLKIKEEPKPVSDTSKNKEILNKLFSKENKVEEKKTIKDSLLETTSNISLRLKNILSIKEVNVNGDVDKNKNENASQNIDKNINQSVDQKVDKNINEIADENIIIEKNNNEDMDISESINDYLNKGIEENLNEHIDINTELMQEEEVKSEENIENKMNETISRGLLKELFPEKKFDDQIEDDKKESSLQVIYKKEDFINSKVVNTIIKKDVLKELFPENYEKGEKQKSDSKKEISKEISMDKISQDMNKLKSKKSVKKNKIKK